jgi:hypothetical protein
MRVLKPYLRVLPLMGLLMLAGCGGGGSNVAQAMPSVTQGVAVGEPSPSGPVRAEFIKLARNAACTDRSNHLYIIDGKQVFWERSGNCPDNAYSYSLFGLTPADLQCSSGDSIAGPRTTCRDESQRALLQTITKNLSKPGLGLDGSHKVEALPIPPADGPLSFEPLLRDDYSGVTGAQNLVVRDSAALQQLWQASFQNRTPAPALPQIDFSQKMLVAVFTGTQSSGCHAVQITRISAAAGKVVVNYQADTPQPGALCTQSLTSPVAMVLVDRIDSSVEFAGT